MGAFFLCRKEFESEYSNFDKIFRSLGFSSFIRSEFQEYTLFTYRKILIDQTNCISDDLTSVSLVGTMTYKGLSYNESLQTINRDHSLNKIEYHRLRGNYFIFLKSKNSLKVLTDGTALISAYHDSGGTFLTSSFIVATGIIKNKEISREAITENILTGAIIGEDTLLKSIRKFSKSSLGLFHSISFRYPETTYSEKIKTRKQALNLIKTNLENYMLDFTALADQYGADCGLTGGFDSRLLLALMSKFYNNFQVHSHYRLTESNEYNIARKIVEDLRIEFHSPVVRSPGSMSDDELLGTLDSSFRFYDGQIRIHCNWEEEYNTFEYRIKILGNKRFGVHGIGGEQYRNADRLYYKKWNYQNWMKYKYLRRLSGKSFYSEREENNFIELLKQKISHQLDSFISNGSMDLFDLKRIQNEIFISSFRGARTSAENKISFFLSPFADYQISRDAYCIIDSLKSSNNFEIELIRMISPELASYDTCYGYKLNRKEPLRKILIHTMFENAMHPYINWRIRELKRKHSPHSGEITSALVLRKRYIQNIKDLHLNLNIDNLITRPDIYPLILSMGYFLERCGSHRY
jgi:hypothetical protein